MPDKSQEIPDFLKDIGKRLAAEPPSKATQHDLLVPPEYSERTIGPSQLADVLFSETVQAALAKLARDTEKIGGTSRLLEFIFPEKVSANPLFAPLRERTFAVLGDLNDPDFLYVTEIEEGDTASVRREDFGLDTGRIVFEIFDVHSEPAEGPGVICPSGLFGEEERGDLWCLVSQTGFYEKIDGLALRPIGVMIRPKPGKAIFYQLVRPVEEVEDALKKSAKSPQLHVEQTEANQALEEAGFRIAVVDFPFKRDQVLEALKRQGFQIEVTETTPEEME